MEPVSSENLILNIFGDKVALGPLRRDLLPRYLRWINDFEVMRAMDIGWRPVTWEAEEAWYEKAAKEYDSPTFTIYERETLRPIGTVCLQDMNRFHRTAELSLMIGETECWGKGYGTEAARLMLDYAFHGQGLHNILARVVSINERGLRALQRAGFREFGRLREASRIGSQVYDRIYLDCLSTEFDSPVLVPLLDRLTGKAEEPSRDR